MENREHSIKDFLSRPRVVAHGNIPAGGASNDTILNLHFPDDLLELEAIREKTKGFLYLRADIIVNIIFTVAPTTSGSFRTVISPDVSLDFFNERTRNNIVSSQFPNHIINIASIPNLIHKIPWISPVTHRNLMNDVGNNGRYSLFRLTPTSAPVSYIVYASFDTAAANFSLTQATPAVPLFTPITVTKEEKSFLQSFNKLSIEQQQQFKNNLKSHTLTERITSTFKGMPIISSFNFNSIPISNLANKLAAAYGYSKPNLNQTVESKNLRPIHNNINCDGDQTSHTFAIQKQNKVKVAPGSFGSDTDELMFSRLYRHPNLIDTFSITNAQTYQHVVFSCPVDGFFSIPIPSFASGLAGDITLTHQAYLMFLFKHWLASVVFNIHIFATQFHSLKLRFVVAPGHHSNSIAGLSIDDSNSTVVNFGLNDFHQVKFPEITNRQFLTNRFWQSAIPPFGVQPANAESSLGRFFILIEVPLLLANDVVAPTVHGIVEAYFDDARFMLPLDFPIAPSLPAVAGFKQPSNQIVLKNRPNSHSLIESVYTSSPCPDSTRNKTVSTNLDTPAHNLTAYEQSAGEAIISLRQFATQFTAPLAVDGGESFNEVSIYDPFRSRFIREGVAPTATGVDKLDYILCPFAFSKGSRHVRVYMREGALPSKYLTSSLLVNTYIPLRSVNTTIIPPSSQVNMVRCLPIVTALEGVADYHIPYYQVYHMLRNGPVNDFPMEDRLHGKPVNLAIRTGSRGVFSFSRAAGDDLAAGYLCGLPTFQFSAGADALFAPNLP